MDALSQIHRDLESLKQRRALALATFAVLLGLFTGILFLQPAGPRILERDAGWAIAFGLLLAGSLAGAAVTIGYPLVRRGAVYATAAAIVAGAVLALALTMDPSRAGAASGVGAGMHCFVYGTGVSAAAMAVLGALSGRLWRRFPDPGFALAVGMTGVGLAALHMRCGGVDPLHLFGFHLTPLVVIYGAAHLAVRARNALSRDD